VLHKTYDHWKSTNPADEFLGPEPEDETPEPVVDEVWDGARAEYVHTVTFASGAKFQVQQTRGGAYSGDYEIVGKDYYADGFLDPETAIDHLLDMVMS